MKYAGWIVAALVVTLALAGDPTCPADVDGNGSVDVGDLLAVLGAWGCTTCPAEDIDDNGVVEVGDLLAVLGAWGGCP